MKIRLADSVSLLLLLPIFTQPSLCPAQEGPKKAFDVWLGTGGNNCGQPAGVYLAKIADDGKVLSKPKLQRKIAGAGWVAHSEASKLIYCSGKVDGRQGVVAFDPSDSSKPLQFEPTGDRGACFLTTDRTGAILISTQYGGGSVAVFPLDKSGNLSPRSQLIEHSGGSKVVGNRQNSPHPHYAAISPDNRFAFILDLGLDQLVRYRIDTENQKLVADGSVDVDPGSGPRHMKFHPSGKFAFVLNEFSMSVTMFSYAAEDGVMEKMKTVATLTTQEQNLNSFNSASEIRIHPGGKMIVTGNRGHDSLSVFKFDESAQSLERTQLESIRGSWPRNFNFSPDGQWILAAGSNSNSLTLFAVDPNECSLLYKQHSSLFVPAPICVTTMAAAKAPQSDGK